MFWESGFRFRAFISWLITISGLLMIVSGVVAYIMPEGRVAYWTEWQFWGLNKEQWNTIHVVQSCVFIFATFFHLVFNWKPLLSYLKDRVTKAYSMRGELVIALLIGIIFTHGSVAGVMPFTSLMDLGTAIGKSWYAEEDVHPPFPHAELMPLKNLMGRIDLSLDGALAHLQEKGFEADGSSTLKQLAANSPASPMEIFETMMMDDRVYQ